MEKKKEIQPERPAEVPERGGYAGYGMCIGLCLGLSVGLACGQMVIGMAAGAVLQRMRKNRTAAGKANRIFFGIKREGRAPFCFPTYNTARTFAVRSLRFFGGSGWISKATFALRKGPYIRARDGGKADKPLLSLEINP